MTEKKYFVTHSAGNILCDHISREKNDGTYEQLSYQDIVDELNRLNDENEELCNFNLHTINQGLQEENKQLKKKVKTLEDTIDGLTGTIAHFDLEEVL